jgi:hypothetical protein
MDANLAAMSVVVLADTLAGSLGPTSVGSLAVHWDARRAEQSVDSLAAWWGQRLVAAMAGE